VDEAKGIPQHKRSEGEGKAFFAKRIVHAGGQRPQDERDVSRSGWKTASFGRGSQRGCPVSADLSVQMGAGVGWLTELCTDFSDCLLSFFPLPSDSCADVI
jgi:hypothetical protein